LCLEKKQIRTEALRESISGGLELRT